MSNGLGPANAVPRTAPEAGRSSAGRCLPRQYKIGNGCLEGVCSDKMTFADLMITINGLKFHMTTVTRDRFVIQIRPQDATQASRRQRLVETAKMAEGGGCSHTRRTTAYAPGFGRRPAAAEQNTKKPLSCESGCELAGARTRDPNIKSVVLYRLSYEFIPTEGACSVSVVQM